MRLSTAVLTAALAVAGVTPAGCSAQELGPADSHDFVGVDTGRVALGDVAPDFTLESLSGERVTLSDLRARREVILVFYRGHW